MNITLTEIKNQYAQEEGFQNWEELQSDCYGYSEDIETHMDEICIRAQKAALEKAAENTSIQYVRPITLNYQEIKDLITNPENLIR